MENKDLKPVQYMSANSRNLRNFQYQQKFKVLVFCGVILAPLFFGGVWYLNNKQEDSNSAIPIAISNPETVDDVEFVQQDIPASQDPSSSGQANSSSNQASGPVANPSPGASSGTGSTPEASGSMPSGVSTAINSIEASGIKDNPYVASSIDSSMLPDGTRITFNKSSWRASDASNGTVDASLSAGGQVYNGVISFSNMGGSWKATGYSIN